MLRRSDSGFTLVELMVGVVLIAILLAMGGPSLTQWLQNGQIRNAAEAMQNGLQLARGDAVRRNSQVRFQLTTSIDASCALAANGTSWVISVDDPTGQCGAAASTTVAPRIVQVRPANEGSANVVIAAGQSTFVFNGLGRLTPVPVADVDIDITNPSGGACAPGGPMRCLRIRVSPGGQMRMCDPSVAAADPRGC